MATTNTPHHELLDVTELAALFNVSPNTVRNLAANGGLPEGITPVRVGALVRFRRSEVDAFLRGDTAAVAA
jgi:excisionase family DNA binding protein